MSYRISFQVISKLKSIPQRTNLKRWVMAALKGHKSQAEITVRIVDAKESAELNECYRHKQGPTNVLAFPFDPADDLVENLLGDLVICAPIVEQEAQEQQKELNAHWAHIIIHGILHLLGYDHETEKQASIMEALEINILHKLSFPNPYAEESSIYA